MSSEPRAAPARIRLERLPIRAAVLGRGPRAREAFVDACAREREERAHAAGRAAGLREAEEAAAGALVRALEELERGREAASARLAGDAFTLAVEIARTLVRREIGAGNHDVERIVRETLAVSGVGRGTCVVHLHPEDARRLEGIAFRAGTRIEADPEVARGDVHVTTPFGVLVRDVDSALLSIGQRLQEEVA